MHGSQCLTIRADGHVQKNRQRDAGAGSVDLYFGPKALAGKQGRWIQTIPGKGWFAYFRVYGPEGPAFEGSWKPGDFEEVK
jgi:hypothetical protein